MFEADAWRFYDCDTPPDDVINQAFQPGSRGFMHLAPALAVVSTPEVLAVCVFGQDGSLTVGFLPPALSGVDATATELHDALRPYRTKIDRAMRGANPRAH